MSTLEHCVKNTEHFFLRRGPTHDWQEANSSTRDRNSPCTTLLKYGGAVLRLTQKDGPRMTYQLAVINGTANPFLLDSEHAGKK
jgi:hypothetical protein